MKIKIVTKTPDMRVWYEGFYEKVYHGQEVIHKQKGGVYKVVGKDHSDKTRVICQHSTINISNAGSAYSFLIDHLLPYKDEDQTSN